MIALRVDVGVANLVAQELRVSRFSRYAPGVIIQEAAKEPELLAIIEYFDWHEIGELAHECLHTLLQPRQIALDLRPEQCFHALVAELGLQLAQATNRITEEPRQGGAHAGF